MTVSQCTLFALFYNNLEPRKTLDKKINHRRLAAQQLRVIGRYVPNDENPPPSSSHFISESAH
jgi:hypothetical protein